MNMEIKKLSVELLEDWLYFFDNIAFTDNEEWEGCYCMCYHWNESLHRKKAWNCSKADAPYNRTCAIDFILKGKMKGYLAYEDGKVVGWCNTNDKEAYINVNFKLLFGDFDKKHRVKSIVCFCISPDARRKGVASSILEKICVDATAEGYDCIEAYPFHHDDNNAYHGPQSMYEKFGFDSCESLNGYTIFRKYL
jgi:ribosomal protein S18 acetylase RimI-like enzyme